MTNYTNVPLEGATDQTTVAAPSLSGNRDVIGKQQLLETVVNIGVTSLICVVSVAGNVVNCLVFWRQGLKDRMNVCLFSLALANGFYMSCTFAVQCVAAFIHFSSELLGEEYSSKGFAYFRCVLYAGRATTHCITMVIAVERCLRVVYPLQARSLNQTHRIKVLVLSLFILLNGLYLLFPFSYHVDQKKRKNEEWHWTVTRTQFLVENNVLVVTLIFVVLESFLPVVALMTVSISTVITVTHLQAAMKWRKSICCRDDHGQQVALTKMLVMVSCVYIITVTPLVSRQISFLFLPQCLFVDSCPLIFSTLGCVVYAIFDINSCVNTFIYYSRSSRFRQELCRIFRDIGKPSLTFHFHLSVLRQ